jgi:hypothetical protein
VTETFILESKKAVIEQETSLTLGPNESKVITLHKVTDPELRQNEFQNFNLSVRQKTIQKKIRMCM